MNRTPLSGARIFVTGASGFVGRHLVSALSARGCRVIGTGTEPSAPFPGLDEWFSADVAHESSITDALGRAAPEAIVHLAGQASAGVSFGDAERTYRVNVLGTLHVLLASAEHAPEARVLLIGSGEAYGPQPEGSRVEESAAFRPVSPYGFSKAAADRLGEAFCSIRGLDVVRTRSFSHAGPGQSSRFALPSFALQIAALERNGSGGAIRVGNLDVTRDILDVRDVVEAYALLLEFGASGAAYNVCSGSGIRLADVVGMLADQSSVPVRVEVDPGRARPADVPYLVGDGQRLTRDTGWRPRFDLRSTVVDLLKDARARVE